MKPGRELDALVAEKVMGFGWCQLMKEGEATKETGPRRCKCGAIGFPYEHHAPYSTEIAAAWQVVEKTDLLAEHYLGKTFDGQPSVFADDLPEPRLVATGDTMPHAICLAALRAVGVEIGPSK